MTSINSLLTPPDDPQFVKLEEKYKCVICKKVLREAVQTSCGHRVCEECLNGYFDGKDEPVLCPAGEEDCDPLYKNNIMPDRSVRRDIRNLLVYCWYKVHGCGEKMPWKELENHSLQCNFRPVECPNKEYGCTLSIPEEKKDVHATTECVFRPIHCHYCKDLVSLAKQEEHELNECNAAPLNCRYGCNTSFQSRKEMNDHIEICPVRPQNCRFSVSGCSFMGNEKELYEHLQSGGNTHLELTLVQMAKLEAGNVTLRRQFQEITAERDTLRRKVENVTAELKTSRTEAATFKAQLEKLKTDVKDMKLKMVSMTERLIHLERKSEDMAKKQHVEKHDEDVRNLQSSMSQVKTAISNLERQSVARGAGGAGTADPDLARRLDQHDTLLGQVDVQMAELDLRFQIMETASYDGHLLWKLRDYNRRKAEAVAGKTLSLYSQPFYTNKFGYKMCARVYLNGDGMGKGSHLSLFFVVMRGEYDNLLPWPFQQKVTMILLDQETGQVNLSDTFRPDPSSTSFKKPTTEMNIASGCPLFVSHSVLETSKYIKDDTLFIKFIVDINNLSHP